VKINVFFIKILIPFFAFLLIVSLVFFIYIFQYVSQSIIDTAYENNKVQLLQTKNTIEQQARIIETSYTTYALTPDFDDKINAPITRYDFRAYYDITSDLSKLSSLTVFSLHNDQALSSIKGNWSIVNDKLLQLSSNQKNKLEKIIKNQDQNIAWVKEKNNLTMRILLPFNKTAKVAVGTFAISNSALDDLIQSKGNKLTIFRGESPIFSQNKNDMSSMVKKYKDRLAIDKITRVEKNDTEYLMTKSSYNNWIYLSKLNLSSEKAMIRKLEVVSVLIVLFVLIAVSLLYYRFTSRMFRPLVRIKEVVGLSKNTNLRDNDLDLVEKYIGSMKVRNANLSANIDLQKEQLQNLFIMGVLNNQLTHEELETRGRYYGYEVTNKMFYTVLTRVTNMSNHPVPDRQLFLIAINNVITETINKEHRLLPIVLNEDIQATIVSGSREEVFEWYSTVRENVAKYLRVDISIGISKQFNDLFEAKNSVEEAKEALYYNQNNDASLMNFYVDITKEDQVEPIKYPIELQSALFDTIRSGEKEIRKELTAIIDSIFIMNHGYLSKNTALVRLVNEIYQFSYQIGVNIEDFRYYKQIYNEILTRHSKTEVYNLIHDKLLKPIILASKVNDNSKSEKSLSKSMINIVHNEFDQELTLEDLGHRLHYNPNYLGKIFRKDIGMNFGEYTQQYRLEMALNLLRDTDITITEIATKLQYKNPQNFIRFFKKKMNVTPKEYRNENRIL
jgi:YesN/AraC family two-component response regulator